MFDNPPMVVPGAERLRQLATHIEKYPVKLDMSSWQNCAWPLAMEQFSELRAYKPNAGSYSFFGMDQEEYHLTFGARGFAEKGAAPYTNQDVAKRFREVADHIEARVRAKESVLA